MDTNKITPGAAPALLSFQAKMSSKLAKTMGTIGSDVGVEKPAFHAAFLFARKAEPTTRPTKAYTVIYTATLRGEKVLVRGLSDKEYISVDKRGEEVISLEGSKASVRLA